MQRSEQGWGTWCYSHAGAGRGTCSNRESVGQRRGIAQVECGECGQVDCLRSRLARQVSTSRAAQLRKAANSECHDDGVEVDHKRGLGANEGILVASGSCRRRRVVLPLAAQHVRLPLDPNWSTQDRLL